MQTYKFIITGSVQGVGYRAFIRENALKEGFRGYVKNLPDDSVEAVVNVSNENELKKFIEILKKGSPFSYVDNIIYNKIDNMEFKNFEIRK